MTESTQVMLFEDKLSAGVVEAVRRLALADEVERGAVFTKASVVNAILDLIGYTAKENLASRSLLEPAFGSGDFLIAAIRRLISSFRRERGSLVAAARQLPGAIRGVELNPNSFRKTRAKVIALLRSEGLGNKSATRLAKAWLIEGDFLLSELPCKFDYVVGNPPYLRHERIPDQLLREYRRRYRTIYDRADLYIPFIERSLDLLQKEGALAFICANRWMKNKYGRKLRNKVSQHFHLVHHIDVEAADAFHSEVSAYPAIFVIQRGSAASTRIARTSDVSAATIDSLVEKLLANRVTDPIEEVEGVVCGEDPWLLDSVDQLGIIRYLEKTFPSLEEAGCKVGIGVATGADSVFIGPFEALDVEEDRKLPLVLASDLCKEGIVWGGQGLINPFLEDGSLAGFSTYPRFAAHMKANNDRLKMRHVARKNPLRWYRTIDRVKSTLQSTPKLLIPDIKGHAAVTYDPGEFYPHHNLYWITSKQWDLQVLQTILRSSVALSMVAAFAVRMNGGFLRFQAQYLRRIRLPSWEMISVSKKQELRNLSTSTNLYKIDAAVFGLYALNKKQTKIVKKLASKARIGVSK